jgi:hypothetical protein
MGDYAPTAQLEAVRVELTTAVEAQLERLQKVWSYDLPAFNAAVKALDVPAVEVSLDG